MPQTVNIIFAMHNQKYSRALGGLIKIKGGNLSICKSYF